MNINISFSPNSKVYNAKVKTLLNKRLVCNVFHYQTMTRILQMYIANVYSMCTEFVTLIKCCVYRDHYKSRIIIFIDVGPIESIEYSVY